MSNLEKSDYNTLDSMKGTTYLSFIYAIFILIVGFFFYLLGLVEGFWMLFYLSIFMFLVTGYFYISYRNELKRDSK